MKFDRWLRFTDLQDLGFGNTETRILNKDGSSNVVKSGISFAKRISLFHSLIDLSPWKLLLLCVLVFTMTNLFFGSIYFLLPPTEIASLADDKSAKHFTDCFFFSAQTITTVGYGSVNPVSVIANAISAFEDLLGWIGFAVLTGLIYARFSRPKAFLLFSKHALISPYKEEKALMFRMAPYKNNNLTEAEVVLNIVFRISQDGKVINKFLPLPTEISRISSLSLNWTVVHHINEHSPLYGMKPEDYDINQTEVLVFVKAYDEHFSNTVQQRTSYAYHEIIHNAVFKPMFRQSDSMKKTVLELDKLNDYTLVS